MDNASLQLEMNNVLAEKAVMLEIEKSMAFVFMTSQVNQLAEKSESERSVREKELEIEDLNRRLCSQLVEIDEARDVSARVSDERDEISARLDARVQEVNELLLKVTELEKNEARVLNEVMELKMENTASERQIESIIKENDDLQTGLIVSNGLVEQLQRNIAKLDEEKKTIADEKIAQDSHNLELQASVDELKKLIESMRINEVTLLRKVADLEKKYAESSRTEVEMKTEIDVLVEEKSLVDKDLEAAMNELEQRKLLYERIVNERRELEDAKREGESEIANTRKQLDALNDIISSLKMTNVSQSEKVKEMEVEVGRYKSLFDETAMEKNEAMKQLDNEKGIIAEFKQTVTRMENEMKDLNKKVATLRTENEKHLHEKKQLEDECAGLVKEVGDLEARFAESRTEFDGKLGAAEANSKRVLNIWKKTVSVCDGESDVNEENIMEDGIKEHVAGIEAIKRAFKDKECRLEEMKRQIELFKSSMDEARKEKNFWTMVSSATTLLATVASLAYVSRAQ
ncbi:hypothetical protein QVD17_07232 [Tagetes erecta]|uniref:Uncharacterized protein n=1 Tax=Tagetes erecta TaxID=13708 RepID=A0AAD8LH20_TARER|nr:hypothetical protein QVD17_07232 [Tagetes erecta]